MVKSFSKYFRDITERLKTEELLRKSEKLAVVGQLATVMAHEINNPLTVNERVHAITKINGK